MPNKRSGRLISQIRGASNNARNASGQHNTSSNNQLVTSIRVFMIDSAGSGFEVLEFAPQLQLLLRDAGFDRPQPAFQRSEEHTSELQSLMRISYAVFCLKKQKKQSHNQKDISKN